ncbi:MAG: DUF4332 domain-containing protein, partial [Anaerolineae bacterium]
MVEPERVTLEPGPASPVEPTEVVREPQDLTRIEGIGPKISQVLQGAGILTFEDLAERKPEELVQILREGFSATGSMRSA